MQAIISSDTPVHGQGRARPSRRSVIAAGSAGLLALAAAIGGPAPAAAEGSDAELFAACRAAAAAYDEVDSASSATGGFGFDDPRTKAAERQSARLMKIADGAAEAVAAILPQTFAGHVAVAGLIRRISASFQMQEGDASEQGIEYVPIALTAAFINNMARLAPAAA